MQSCRIWQHCIEMCIRDRINAAREELKNRILAKQDKERRSTELYKYMHNLLGAQIVEIFDAYFS